MKRKVNLEKIGIYIACATLVILLWQIEIVVFSHIMEIKERLSRVEERVGLTKS